MLQVEIPQIMKDIKHKAENIENGKNLWEKIYESKGNIISKDNMKKSAQEVEKLLEKLREWHKQNGGFKVKDVVKEFNNEARKAKIDALIANRVKENIEKKRLINI